MQAGWQPSPLACVSAGMQANAVAPEKEPDKNRVGHKPNCNLAAYYWRITNGD
ncbi:hypothetical protein [Alkanindiges illinoisensis]|uniref:hypothetical protein n=1 Tax=Alkanindiges illinoisensis TaxID=197183 RepID=UPI0012EBEE28|nr:hypothetical protein [Alkanindiges illinoisensis]